MKNFNNSVFITNFTLKAIHSMFDRPYGTWAQYKGLRPYCTVAKKNARRPCT